MAFELETVPSLTDSSVNQESYDGFMSASERHGYNRSGADPTRGARRTWLAGVAFRNVTKIFGKDVKAVNDLNLEIRDKEFMVL
ncbi:hypothetical protein LXA30_17555, partial [Erwinia amylovora]|uniref:hypothetical protein n=1 Tax=Erwinia amylovora TaxID=552 RepID=UPI0020BD6F16